MTVMESKKTITANKAFGAGMSVNASEREITAWLEANPTAKITYTIDGKKYTVAMPTSREEVSRLRHAMAFTTSAKTRIAIEIVLKAFEALAAWMSGLKMVAPAATQETPAEVSEPAVAVEVVRPEGYAIVEASQANCLRDYAPGEQFWVYGSPMRPMSASWVRIDRAVFVTANHIIDKVYAWCVTPYELDTITIDRYELCTLHEAITWQPENVPTQQQEELQHASQSDEDATDHSGGVPLHPLSAKYAEGIAERVDEIEGLNRTISHIEYEICDMPDSERTRDVQDAQEEMKRLQHKVNDLVNDLKAEGIEIDYDGPLTQVMRNGVLWIENDGKAWKEVEQRGLHQIAATQCVVGADCMGEPPQCTNTATWAYNGNPLCIDCMRAMSGMNSDNRDAFAPAIEPELIATAQDKGVILWTEYRDMVKRVLMPDERDPRYMSVEELANIRFPIAYVSPASFVAAYEARIPAIQSK